MLDPASPESFREKLAMILAAHLNGNAVLFGFSGCSNQRNVTIPIITSVVIY